MFGENIRKEAFDLDTGVSAIKCTTVHLNDIKVELMRLRESMDAAVLKKEEHFRFEEHYRKVRILSELMFYVSNELNEEIEKVEEISDKIFESVIKGEKKEETVV